MDPVNIPAKFEVRSFTRSWDNRGYSKNLGSPCVDPPSVPAFHLSAPIQARRRSGPTSRRACYGFVVQHVRPQQIELMEFAPLWGEAFEMWRDLLWSLHCH